MKSFLRLFFLISLSLLLTLPAAQAGKDPNMLKAGVSYIWLSENDSQGIMFSNRFSHQIGEKFSLGLNVGLAEGARYDDRQEIFTIKNTFYMVPSKQVSTLSITKR